MPSFQCCFHGFITVHPFLVQFYFFQYRLGTLRIVPEIGLQCKLLFFGYKILLKIDVKETSSERSVGSSYPSVAQWSWLDNDFVFVSCKSNEMNNKWSDVNTSIHFFVL
jgi:hypothetical protein